MEKPKLEFTVKAVVIGLVLAVVFCGANTYLGLKIGNTISASIPASIIAMAILRLFKKYSTLENSIAQATASVGESVAVVVIFVFPALLILKIWNQFDYLQIVLIAIPGALIGVAYSIILRKVLLDDKNLTFPEGQAIGSILQNTEKSESESAKSLILGSIISAILNFCQVGLQVLSSGITKAFKVSGGLVGGGISFSAAIIGAGYLVGFMQMFVSFIGLIFAWVILLPIFAAQHGISDPSDLTGSAFKIWSTYIRPIGIGVMLFSGLATMLILVKPIFNGLRESLKAVKQISHINMKDKDISIAKLMLILFIAIIPLFLLIIYKLGSINLYSLPVNIILAIAITFIVLVLGFIVAAVAGYFAGFIGSTNSPTSGLLFIGVIVISLVVKLASSSSLSANTSSLLLTTCLLVGFIGFTACVSNSSIQDFKSGQIVGSTPYKQQLGLFMGVIVSSLVAPVIVNLIFNAYGIAGVAPHPGIDPNTTLSAPQASAVAALAQNIIGGSQNWNLIVIGVIAGAIALIIDTIGKTSGKFRFPTLSFGVGIYLPPDLIATLFIGGLLKLLVSKKFKQMECTLGKDNEKLAKLKSNSNLLVCGLVAGESIMGLLLAIPFVIKQSSDVLKIVGDSFAPIANILSIIVIISLLIFIYRFSTKIKAKNLN